MKKHLLIIIFGVAFAWFFLGISPGMLLMIFLALLLIGLGFFKDKEPVYLVPLGFGILLANVPGTNMSSYHYEIQLQTKMLERDEGVTLPEKFNLAKGENYVYFDATGKLVINNDSIEDKTCIGRFLLNKEACFQRDMDSIPMKCSGIEILDKVFLNDGDNIQIGKNLYTVSVSKGLTAWLYSNLIATGFLTPLIFLGLGMAVDFAPLMRNAGLTFLGAFSQVGIFLAFVFSLFTGMFTPEEAASLAMIGALDGPLSVYLSNQLVPEMLGSIAVITFGLMVSANFLIPIIVDLTTSSEERRINMKEQEERFQPEKLVFSKKIKIIFPVGIVFICSVFIPSATILIGMLMFGNLLKEVGLLAAVEKISGVSKGTLINILIIILGFCVGATLEAEVFLNFQTIGIIFIGLIAFSLSVAGGIYGAKLWNMHASESGKKLINPMVGAAGVSAFPSASRIVNEIAIKEDSSNDIYQYCLASNLAGVIVAILTAGYFLNKLG